MDCTEVEEGYKVNIDIFKLIATFLVITRLFTLRCATRRWLRENT